MQDLTLMDHLKVWRATGMPVELTPHQVSTLVDVFEMYDSHIKNMNKIVARIQWWSRVLAVIVYLFAAFLIGFSGVLTWHILT